MIAGNLKLKGNHIGQPSSGALEARASGSEEPWSRTPASQRRACSNPVLQLYLIIVIDDIRNKEAAQNNTGSCHARVVLFIVRGVHKVEKEHLCGLEQHKACSLLS